MDPRQFKTDEEYAFACKTAWAWARAGQDILDFIQSQIDQSDYLSKKERGELKDKLRESFA